LKLTGTQHLVNAGPFTRTNAWNRVEVDLREAISGVVWPQLYRQLTRATALRLRVPHWRNISPHVREV
jgi:hypothetical protein